MNAAPAVPGLHRVDHDSETSFIGAVVRLLELAIAGARSAPAPVRLLLSGGTTPVPAYRALAARRPDWTNVQVELVDDRWVGPQAPGSNARLVRDELLAEPGPGAAPRFWPLVDLARGLPDCVEAANARVQACASAPALVLLGMGGDAHTASLFPGSRGLAQALQSPAPYAAIDATGCPGAGSWPLRISLTPAGWRHAARRVLLVRGHDKRAVLERALHEGDPLAFPVCAALHGADAPLEIHWCP